jgi:hypothetical protein
MIGANTMTPHKMHTHFSALGCLALFLATCLYYLIFAHDLSSYSGNSGFFQLALNEHDHWIYYNNIDHLRRGDVAYELSNDFGIAYIHYIFALILGLENDSTYAFSALLFNLIIMFFVYKTYLLICSELGIGLRGVLAVNQQRHAHNSCVSLVDILQHEKKAVDIAYIGAILHTNSSATNHICSDIYFACVS